LSRRLRLRQKYRREKNAEGGDATAAGDKQLGSCAAEKIKYSALRVQWQVNPRSDVPSASLNRWP
jgi:hypothetical protein